MIDAGFFLLCVILIFTAVVLVRKHYRRMQERGQDADKPPDRTPDNTVLIPDALTVGSRLRNIIADQLGIDAWEIRDEDTLSALGADKLDAYEVPMECEYEFSIKIADAAWKRISDRMTVAELEAILKESGAKDL